MSRSCPLIVRSFEEPTTLRPATTSSILQVTTIYLLLSNCINATFSSGVSFPLLFHIQYTIITWFLLIMRIFSLLAIAHIILRCLRPLGYPQFWYKKTFVTYYIVPLIIICTLSFNRFVPSFWLPRSLVTPY